MSIEFKKIKDRLRCKSPFKDFSLVEVPFEIRFDPLTGQTSRIFDLPYRPVPKPDFVEMARKSMELGCPFCPESVEKATPLFPTEIVPAGRIHVGRAWVVPNLLPLDRYAGVCILCEEHFIPLGGFTPEILYDGFLAARALLEEAAKRDPEVNYFNINWNYMPPAGSSMVHPHLQANCGPTPVYQHRVQLEASFRHRLRHGKTFWEEFTAAERQAGERFLAEIGPTFWTMAFAPQGALPDVWCIFPDYGALLQLDEPAIGAFLKGLSATLAHFDEEGLYSFNVSMFSGREENGHFRVNARITPRLLLREIGNSDQTYYQVLLREPCSIRSPESDRPKVLKAFERFLTRSSA